MISKNKVFDFIFGTTKATTSPGKRRNRLARFVIGSQEEHDPAKEWAAFIISSLVVAALVGVIKAIWSSAIPYDFFELWNIKGGPLDWIKSSVWVFAWGAGFTAVVSMLTRNKEHENRYAEEYLQRGFWVSVRAGLMEEVLFRWLLFMFMIVFVKVVNFILLGFAGFGLVELLHNYVMGPVANFFTLGLLSNLLVDPAVWAVGAGLLAANAKFRDGHKYLGFIGLVNSWFIGMFFFYLMFKYGLLAAIVVHFLYDLFIFIVRYIDCVIERARGGA